MVAAVPFALKLPECSVVPAEHAVPLAALLTETVATPPVAVSTAPTIALIVEAWLMTAIVALLGLTVAIQPTETGTLWSFAMPCAEVVAAGGLAVVT